MARTVADFRTNNKPWWCPGCGDFAVMTALQKAAAKLGLDPEKVVVVSGIGCSGKLSDYFNSYGFHSMHGRTLPAATGIKLANRDLTVIAAGGDGDGYGIGLNHFLHSIRRNVDITYLVMDNHIYGLTKGQFSPTSDPGHKTVTSPEGTLDAPVQPITMALATGIGYVAQGFSGDPNQMADLIVGAIEHKGFSLVNLISPCVTFNKVNTYDYYKENLINLAVDEKYDSSNRGIALQKMMETNELVTGLIYKGESTPLEDTLPGYDNNPLVKQDLNIESDRWFKAMQKFA